MAVVNIFCSFCTWQAQLLLQNTILFQQDESNAIGCLWLMTVKKGGGGRGGGGGGKSRQHLSGAAVLTK